MDLRLKFIDIKKSDVIATSGVIVASGACANQGLGATAFEYVNSNGNDGYYLFKDGTENGTNKVAGKYMGEYGRTSIIDKDGINLGDLTYPTVGKHYHYANQYFHDDTFDGGYFLIECVNSDHYGTFQ